MISFFKDLIKRKTILALPKKVDIIIFGHFTKNFCTKKKASFLILKDQLYLIIFIKALIRYIFKKRKISKSVVDFYFIELIDYISPKIAIGNEINKNIFKFKKYFPNKVSIGYQLVHWSNIHKFLIKKYFGDKKNYSCDYFLTFNKNSLKYLNFIKTNFIVSGSVKNNFNLVLKKKKIYDLLLISDYRDLKKFNLKDKHSVQVKKKYYNYFSKILFCINKVAKQNNLKICVAFASKREEKKQYNFFNQEYNFFNKNLQKFEIGDKPAHELAAKSKMVISFWSTLGFEIFSQNKKVLFLSPNFSDYWNVFPKKNGFNWYQSINQKKIYKKIVDNLEINDNQWLKKTQKFRSFFHFDPKNLALNDILRKNI
tara:strand:- start:10811 stop:11917 length:1107 start_codon:yes stop_codon:yes gene_type:complete